MLRRLAIAFTATVAIANAPGRADAASATVSGEFAGGGGGFSRSLPHRSGGALRSGAANRFGESAARAGSGYAGTNPRVGSGSHDNGGWYQRGWGGTLSPGWGYGFGTNLGGVGR